MPFILDKEIDPLYKEGVEKGKIEAEKQTKIKIAKNMLKQNIDIEVVVKSTDLSKEELEKIMPNHTK